MDLSYILNHLGEDREQHLGAVSPPLFSSVNYAFPSVGEMREKLKKEMENPFYSRGFNPTVAVLRKKLAALEGTEDAMVFASGSAAATAAIMSCVKAGDHIVSVKKPYSWTATLMGKYLERFGVKVSYATDGTASAFEKVCTPNTKLIFLESPNSLTFEQQDIRAITTFAKSKNILTCIDNTYASPLNQQPGSMGVDIIIHSATKYLNGHSDVVAGVVCTTHERILRIMSEEYMTLGAVISAHDAWMILRGLRTLELRVNRSSESAKIIAEWFSRHPGVKKVYYPHINDPERSRAQLCKSGGLISVQFHAKDEKDIERIINALKRFLIATSWGGYESLAFPLCALAASKSFEDPLPWDMVRFYIGLEDPQVLIADLEQALGKV